MVDIHAHILPGLDDGSPSLEESLRMARIAAESGIYHMAATSHGNLYSYLLEEYREAFDLLQREIDRRRISLKLHPGMELFADEIVFRRLEKGQLLTLNDTDYILIEFDFQEDTSNVLKRIRRLFDMGYRIVLAHPERYRFIQEDLELACYLEEQGCVLQVNCGSLTGDFGRECQHVARFLLRNGLVGVLATDSHDSVYRSPDIGALTEMLRTQIGPAASKLLLSENPSRILKGYDILRQEYKEKEE